MKALIIDIEPLLISPTQEQTKLFFTLFRTIQHKKAINTAADLADQSFIYVITSINPTAHHDDNSDLFAYIITSQYISNKFYRVMINTGVSKRSTASYKQYLVYKKTYNTIINTSKAGAINIQFSISSTLSIGSIMVNILVSNIKFYIIKADTPFLLCFANINILKIYYNNLKNVLVTPTKTVPVIY